MYFEQFYLQCLSHASYLLGSEGEAAVVDPQRDIDGYLQAAEQHGLKIRHIFETHLHADFVSGHRELAARTGAAIYVCEKAGADFPHVPVAEGFSLKMGKVRITVLETPGHTLESVCLAVADEETSPDTWAVLTGDTLFIGDVGRPDLSETQTPQQLAGMLYESLYGKLLQLPDHVLVFPAHGAGSLCGRNMRQERSSTIGAEKLTNHALQARSRDEFVGRLTSSLPSRPDYFLKDAQINREGACALSELPELPDFTALELRSLMKENAIALDVRAAEEFAAAHIPGSINVPLAGPFASWAATILGLSSCPALVAGAAEQYSEARLRLARVGIENLRGLLKGGVKTWESAGLPVARTCQMTVQELQSRLAVERIGVLDVRREPEWEAGHIAGATWWPLDNFAASLPEIVGAAPVAIHCKSGYRSMIACSLLQRAGFHNVINVIGGFDGWQQANLPVETGRKSA